jgi:adenine-specific DNA-methyltransferase
MLHKIKVTDDYDPTADVVHFHGDCTDLLERIPDKSLRLIVTSPPYNLGKPYEQKVEQNTYVAQQERVIDKCIEKLADDGSICWQIGNYVENVHIVPLDILLYPIFIKHKGVKLRNRIIWHFGHGLHAKNRFSGRYEVVLWFTKSDDYFFNVDPIREPQKYPNKKHFKGINKGQLSSNPLGKNPSDVWNIPNVKWNHVEKTIHPCQFPVELVERLILSMTEENDWVFDPFMGVASTTIAAILNRRRAIGAEILEEYVKIGRERIAKAILGELKTRPMWKPIYEPQTKNRRTIGLRLNEASELEIRNT